MSWIQYYKEEDKLLVKANNSTRLPSPPGFDETTYKKVREARIHQTAAAKKTSSKKKDKQLERIRNKKLWELAIQPTKSIPMNLIMMYMTPNSIQIISIMMTAMLFINPVKEILSVNSRFANVQVDNSKDKLYMKAIYVFCCFGNLLVGLWKLNAMGLIPNKTGDWIGWSVRMGSTEEVVI